MKRIIIHLTAGNYAPNPCDLEHYHFVIGGNGTIHEGKYKPLDNENCSDGKYAAHTGGGNTGSIGVAMACMYGFKNRVSVGNYPITRVQFEACMKKVAELCKEYNIPITLDTVLTHYEFGEKHPNTTSKGKVDIIYLPPFPSLTMFEVGNFIRKKVRWYLSRIG